MKSLDLVRWIEFESPEDERGVLTAIESGDDIPFEIERIFYIHHIKAPRGGHAHRDTDQVLIAIHGSFEAYLFDGRETRTFAMDDPRRGLYIPRMVFIEMDRFAPGSVGLVLASSHYDKGRSLRSRDQYLRAVEGQQGRVPT